MKRSVRKIPTTLRVNGDEYQVLVKPWQTLLEVLRDELILTGTKEGCSNGNCGACTVILDGSAIDSCLAFAAEADGHDILTIEGLAQGRVLHPLQQAFIDHGGLQCGFCTPGGGGFLMSAKAPPGQASQPHGGRGAHGGRRQPVPLHRVRQDYQGHNIGSWE